MEMLNDLNALMQFYRQNVQGPRQNYNSWDGAARMANDNGEAALWARDMIGRGSATRSPRPDFFADDETPRNAMMEFAPPMQRPMRSPVEDPMRPQIRNYIARMLGGR